MAIIEAETPEIEKELKNLVSLVEKGGGGFHSDLVIRTKDGGLSIETKAPLEGGKEIIRLSRDVLLPLEQFEVTVKDDEFTASFPKGSPLSDLQKKLVDSMMTLYTLTNKARLHREGCFFLMMADHQDILARIQEARMFGGRALTYMDEIKKGLKGKELDDFVAATFLKTRQLGYEDKEKTASMTILMPVVDFLNHHWMGSSFGVGKGVRPGDLAVANSQPVENSLECFAFYNIMDSLDSLIQYDFIDEFAPVVRSVAIDLEVPGSGVVKINNMPGVMYKKKLAKNISDLRRFMPHINKEKPDSKEVKASHLLIPSYRSPLAMRRILAVLLGTLGVADQNPDFLASWVNEAEHKVIEANKAYYQSLLKDVQEKAKKNGSDPALDSIKSLAEIQLSKLSNYKFAGAKVAA